MGGQEGRRSECVKQVPEAAGVAGGMPPGKAAFSTKGPAFLVGAALFMETLDGALLANALPTIADSFGMPAIDLKSVMTAYLAAVAACIPISGWMARRVGDRRLFCLALGGFTLASLLCAASQSFAMLIAARIVQGMAAAMMVPVGRLLVLRTLPKEQLVHAVAILTWPALLAPAIAPLLSGLVIEWASWRWLFTINIPVGLAGMVFAARILPATPPDDATALDRIGLALWMVLAGSIVFLVGDLAAFSPQEAAMAVMLLAGVAALLWRHLRRTPRPILELRLLRISSFAHTVRGGSLVRMAIFANPFLLPLMCQIGLGMSALESGAFIFMGMIGNIGVKPLTTPVLRRFRPRTIILANGTLLSLGFALFAAITEHTPGWAILALLIVTGMGRSLHFTTLNTLAFRDVSTDDMNGANTLFSTALQMNAALGVALGALALALWPLVGPAGDDPLAPFRFAFLAVAILCFAGISQAYRLDRPQI